MAVEIEWIDSESAAATGNKIYRDTVPSTGEVEIADIANGVQIYQDNTAEVGTGVEYKYVIQAHDGAGDETTQEVEGDNMDYITTAGGGTGTELFPQDNAASEADLNSDGVWSGINANVTSISGDAAPDSTYAIQIESSVVSSTGRGEIVWAQEIGDSLTIKLWVKVVQGSFARIDGWTGFAEDVDSGILNDVDDGDWTEYTYNVTADAVQGKMRIYSAYNTSGTLGDIILVDRVTVIKP